MAAKPGITGFSRSMMTGEMPPMAVSLQLGFVAKQWHHEETSATEGAPSVDSSTVGTGHTSIHAYCGHLPPRWMLNDGLDVVVDKYVIES